MSLAAAIIDSVGQLTGAAGSVVSGLSAGTAECGARPLLGKNRKTYDECVRRNLDIREQGAAPAVIQKQTQEPVNPMLIIGVVVVVIVVLVMIFRKK